MPKKITEKEIKDLLNDFRSGISITSLVKSYGYSKTTINKYLKKNIDEKEYKVLTKSQLLNNEISNDSRLGKQFQIGHSFFTPTESIKNKDSKSWFNEVVESEIKPLLEEHWFDAPEEVEKSIKKLITD